MAFFFPEFSYGLQHVTPKSFRSELSPELECYGLNSYWTPSVECSKYHRIEIFKTEPVILLHLTRPALFFFSNLFPTVTPPRSRCLDLKSWLFQQLLEPVTSPSLNLMGPFLLFCSHLDPLCLPHRGSSHRSVSLVRLIWCVASRCAVSS